jgi:hypothetical protein
VVGHKKARKQAQRERVSEMKERERRGNKNEQKEMMGRIVCIPENTNMRVPRRKTKTRYAGRNIGVESLYVYVYHMDQHFAVVVVVAVAFLVAVFWLGLGEVCFAWDRRIRYISKTTPTRKKRRPEIDKRRKHEREKEMLYL